MSMPGVRTRPATRAAGRPGLRAETEAALEPLRAALLSHARTEAGQIRAGAEDDATRALDAARAELAEEVASARAQGEADARAYLRRERARVQQRNRGLVLRAQRQVYDELVDSAEDAVGRLLTDPQVRERLAARLRDRLGPTAVVVDTTDGGLRARTPEGRAVDASVTALVRDALTRLDLEGLWAPAG